ncbi:LapA family protein [Bdellovibrionota bacterium FG-1]
MTKKVFYLIFMFLLVLFVVQNTSHVPVVFLTGKAHFRSIFLMISCFFGGFFTGYYFVFRKEERLIGKMRKVQSLLDKERRKNQKLLEDD